MYSWWYTVVYYDNIMKVNSSLIYEKYTVDKMGVGVKHQIVWEASIFQGGFSLLLWLWQNSLKWNISWKPASPHLYGALNWILYNSIHFAKVLVEGNWTKGQGPCELVVITCSKKAPERVQAAAEYSPIISKHRTQINLSSPKKAEIRNG